MAEVIRSIVPMISPMLAITPLTPDVVARTDATCSPISSVAFAVRVASDLTSAATTAKPRPASPALAASMVALSASRLVCAAISLIRPMTSPIFWASRESAETMSPAFEASVTAF